MINLYLNPKLKGILIKLPKVKQDLRDLTYNRN